MKASGYRASEPGAGPDDEASMADRDPAWLPTAALIRVVALGVLGVGAALLTGRADLVAVIGPLVLMAGLAWAERGARRVPVVAATVPPQVPGGGIVAVELSVAAAGDAQLLTVTVPSADGDASAGRLSLAADSSHETVWTTAPDWGAATLARPDLVAVGPDGLWEAGPVIGQEAVATALPTGSPPPGLTLPPILGGWAGEHRSRRPGQGGELVDLREFAPGDRLRAVHWRAFARHQRLFVRRTLSDADADVVIVVDTRSEVMPQAIEEPAWWPRTVARWRRRGRRLGELMTALVRIDTPVPAGQRPPAVVGSLDLTVRAAASIAAAQLQVGDRVGLLDLSTWRRGARMGAGRRQLERIRYQLSGLRFRPATGVVRVDLWNLPTAAVVVLVSPLTDDSITLAAADCRARGHQVFVVDVLPERSLRQEQGRTLADRAELAVLLAERRRQLAELRRHGIPVVHQDDPGLVGQWAAVARTVREPR